MLIFLQVKYNKVECCFMTATDEQGLAMTKPRLVNAENYQATKALFVEMLSNRKKFVLKHNLPKHMIAFMLITGDKPQDLEKPYFDAEKQVLGDFAGKLHCLSLCDTFVVLLKLYENFCIDVLQITKFALDIFHCEQQHNRTVPMRLDKAMYCADFKYMLSLLRGPKLVIDSNHQYSVQIQQLFCVAGMKELVKGLLMEDTDILQNDANLELIATLSTLLSKYQPLNQFYLGLILLPFPENHEPKSVTFTDDDNNSCTFSCPFMPLNLFQQVLRKLYDGLDVPIDSIQPWIYSYVGPEQFKFFFCEFQRWHNATWIPLGNDALQNSPIASNPNVSKDLKGCLADKKFKYIYNNYYDGTTGPYGSSPIEAIHSKLESVTALKKVSNAADKVKLLTDIFCRSNFSILNKDTNFTLSGNDKKLLHSSLHNAFEFNRGVECLEQKEDAYQHLIKQSLVEQTLLSAFKMLEVDKIVIVYLIVSVKNRLHSNTRVSAAFLRNSGFAIGRGRWTKALKHMLDSACTDLEDNIDQAQYAGSVLRYLAHKCGLPQHRVEEQMKKYNPKRLSKLQRDFKQKYVLLSNICG